MLSDRCLQGRRAERTAVPRAVTTTVAYMEPLAPNDGRTAADREPINALGSMYSNEYACENNAETTPAVAKRARKWYLEVDSFRSEPGSRFGCHRYAIAAAQAKSVRVSTNLTLSFGPTRPKAVESYRVEEEMSTA